MVLHSTGCIKQNNTVSVYNIYANICTRSIRIVRYNHVVLVSGWSCTATKYPDSHINAVLS